MSDMGTFRVDIEIQHPWKPERRELLSNVLVDTGAELSCLPAALLESLGIERRKQILLRQADGSVFARWIGPAILHAAGSSTVDEVIFGEPNDIKLLGCHSLEGLNLRIDPVRKQLTDAGPMDFAAAA